MCFPFDFSLARMCRRHAWPWPIVLIFLMPYGAAFALNQPSQPAAPAAGATPSSAGLGNPNQSGGEQLQPWSITPSFHVGEIYVNSSRGASSASSQPSEYYVTEANPELSINGRGPRASLNLRYRMQNIFYARHTAADATYHQLNASGKTTLVPNFLYFDAASRMSQQIINPTERIYLGNFSISSNRTDVRTYSLTPYIRYRLGSAATATVRYSRQSLSYSKRSQYDNNSNIYSASIQSGDNGRKLSWGVNYSNERILYDSYSNVYFETLEGQLGWRITRSLILQGTLGYDKNNYISSFGRTKGKRWSVGFTWSPSIRTSLSASYGRRYFGNVYSLGLTHSSRFTTWHATYTVQPRTVRGLQNSSYLVGLINPSGQVSLVNFLVPTITHEVYITKRGRLSVKRRLREGSIDVSIYGTRREYQQSGRFTYYYGTYDTLTQNLGQRSTLALKGAWVRYNYQTGSGYNYWYTGLEFSRHFGKKVSGSLRYLYSVHSNSSATGGYSESIVSAFFDVKF